VIGRSQIQPILTGARNTTEQGVQDLMQRTLDNYGSGVQITQVQMQKVDPPTQVIDAFRDVQAARADFERLQHDVISFPPWRLPRHHDEENHPDDVQYRRDDPRAPNGNLSNLTLKQWRAPFLSVPPPRSDAESEP